MTASLTHMRAEIDEAGAAIARQLAGDAGRIDATRAQAARARSAASSSTIARGSSDHCALYLKYLVEIALGIPCASIGPSIASLYARRCGCRAPLAVSISQSGRSPDIVEMQRSARNGGRADHRDGQRRRFAAGDRGRGIAAADGGARAVRRRDKIDDRGARRRGGARRGVARRRRSDAAPSPACPAILPAAERAASRRHDRTARARRTSPLCSDAARPSRSPPKRR